MGALPVREVERPGPMTPLPQAMLELTAIDDYAVDGVGLAYQSYVHACRSYRGANGSLLRL